MTISGLFSLEKFQNFQQMNGQSDRHKRLMTAPSRAKGFVQSKEMENLSIKDAAIDERVVAPPSVNVLTGNTFW